jgi:hypothetical protein
MTAATTAAAIDMGRDDVFHYESKYKVLICKKHQYAVRNPHDHLRDKHAEIAIEGRRAIIERYAGCERWEPAKVQLPPPLGPPIPALGQPLKALQCNEKVCGFISINRKEMLKHCNKIHNWRHSTKTPVHWNAVHVQTFFTSGGFRRYFVVRVIDTDDNSEHGERDNSQQARNNLITEYADDAAIIKQEWTEAQKRHQQELEIADKKIALTDRTGWFIRTGWLEHLAGRNKRRLAHASRLPDRREQELRRACEIVDRAVERSVAGLMSLAQETRRWLRSVKRGEVDVRPMGRLQNPESQARYTRYMKRFVCYCLRIVEAGAQHAREQIGQQDSDHESRSSNNNSSQNDEDDESNKEEDSFYDARKLFLWHGNQKQLAEEMWQLLVIGGTREGEELEEQIDLMIELLGSFIFQTVGDEPFTSPLIHFLAVLGIDEEMDRLRKAEDYSFILAGVVYCVRVLALEMLLPSLGRKEQGEVDRERFLHMRRKFLTDGSYSPMSTMISLLAYSKHVTLNKSNTGSVQWSADQQVLYFRGRPIVISRFQQMIQDAIAEAEQVLWEELMWVTQDDPGQRFTVPLDRIVDDMTFTKREFSFVNRSGNGLTGGLDWMIGQMQKISSRDRQLRRGGIWKTQPIRQYLRKVNRFREMLLFCVHISGGQPARGTEITSARHQNGFLQDRNVYVMDGRVVMITRYHKSQSQYDTPKIISRFLPWRVGQLMAVYLGYVRRFAEYLMVQVSGTGWSDYIWANDKGPWETNRLTSVIKLETAHRLGERLTTLDYRHVAISIGRVFVGEQFAAGYREGMDEVDEPEMEEDGDNRSDPLELQAGRGERMGERRYGVPINMVQHLSPRSVDTFRRLSEGWHRFLGLSSTREEEGRLAQEQVGSNNRTTPTVRGEKRGQLDREQEGGGSDDEQGKQLVF